MSNVTGLSNIGKGRALISCDVMAAKSRSAPIDQAHRKSVILVENKLAEAQSEILR